MAWRVRLVTLFALLLGAASAYAAGVRAWLDRETMQPGETVTLNVEAANDGDAQPDFSPLAKDFDLLGTSNSSSLSLVNGQASAKQLWAIGLQPKHEGRIEIPPLTVGAERTSALVLTVAPAAPESSMHAGDDAFVEISAEPKNPYVQQQVRCTVKLYYAMNLTDGVLEDPHAPGVLVQKLGQDRSYQAELGGRVYHVVERRYALSVEGSGALTIPPLNFRGRAVTGNDPASMFFARGRELAARSDALALEVRPRPPAAEAGAWLPAQFLNYTLHGADGAVAHVGEPLTLTLELRAQGLAFEQLPELMLPAIDGAEVYPDKSTTRTRDDGVWLIGERQRKFAVVPTRAGVMKLPALRLAWWDTQNDRAAVIEIPAREIDVQLASGVAATPPAATEMPIESTPGAPATPAPAKDLAFAPSADTSGWKWLALASFALWLITLFAAALLWRRRVARRRTITAANDDAAPRAAREHLRRACAAGDAAAAARALLDAGRAQGIDVRNLGELGEALGADDQRAALAQLERARFGRGDAAGACTAVAKAFAKGFVRPAVTIAVTPPLLAPLYPNEKQRKHRA